MPISPVHYVEIHPGVVVIDAHRIAAVVWAVAVAPRPSDQLTKHHSLTPKRGIGLQS